MVVVSQKLESQVLADVKQIKAVKKHDDLLIHYGGTSGKGWVNAKGMNTNIETVKQLFNLKKKVL